jgi:hypothetical protein
MTSKWKKVAAEIISKTPTHPTDKTDESPVVFIKTATPPTDKTDESPDVFLKTCHTPTDKTDETPHHAVSSVEVTQSAKSRLAQALFGKFATHAELDLMVKREAYFIERGYSQEVTDYLMDRLMLRDRKREDGQTCAECANFTAKTNICHQPRKARLSLSANANVTPQMITQPHQCRGFTPAIKGVTK